MTLTSGVVTAGVRTASGAKNDAIRRPTAARPTYDGRAEGGGEAIV
jgi:hypothetical protein